MDKYLKFIYDNYSSANRFVNYWFAFENFLDHFFPYSGYNDSFRERLQRFENSLKDTMVHEVFCQRLYCLAEARALAELQPLIFRETNEDTSAHKAFASDYSRVARGEKPKEPVVRLINLLYTVRCNSEHGQKPLPSEWEDVQRRNEEIFNITTPLLACLDELVLTQFVVLGVFSYGTLQEATSAECPYDVERHESLTIRGRLHDMGRFPAWRYNTWERVHGCVLRAADCLRLKHVQFCDEVEGHQFRRRLEIAYDQEGRDGQYLVWAYHFESEPDFGSRIADGIWRGPSASL